MGNFDASLFYALLCGIPIVIISSIDDLMSLSHKIRMVVQIVSVLAAVIILGEPQTFDFTFFQISQKWLLYGGLVLGLVWFINLFNFLDGIDSYASMEAIFLSLAMYLLSGNFAILLITGSVAGFLFWNFPAPRAKIFMGDVGSTFLGFSIGIFALYLNNIQELNFSVFILLSLVFTFDATATLLIRLFNRERISEAHKKHMFQRLHQIGFTHLEINGMALLLNISLLGLAILCASNSSLLLPALIVYILLLSVLMAIIYRKHIC